MRDLIATGDLASAYAVQRVNIERELTRGARWVGRKIGLTSCAVQQQPGVDQPDLGVLLDDMAVGQDEPVRLVLGTRPVSLTAVDLPALFPARGSRLSP